MKQKTLLKLRFATIEIKLWAQRIKEVLRFLGLCKLIGTQKQQITKYPLVRITNSCAQHQINLNHLNGFNISTHAISQYLGGLDNNTNPWKGLFLPSQNICRIKIFCQEK